MTRSGFDYNVIAIGSGFGGSVAAAEGDREGLPDGVLESGKRLPDEDIPNTSWDIDKFVWQPELEMFGVQRIEFLDDVQVLCGAGVGGASLVYANTLMSQCHGSRFDITSGDVLRGPATEPFTTYDARELDGASGRSTRTHSATRTTHHRDRGPGLRFEGAPVDR